MCIKALPRHVIHNPSSWDGPKLVPAKTRLGNKRRRSGCRNGSDKRVQEDCTYTCTARVLRRRTGAARPTRRLQLNTLARGALSHGLRSTVHDHSQISETHMAHFRARQVYNLQFKPYVFASSQSFSPPHARPYWSRVAGIPKT